MTDRKDDGAKAKARTRQAKGSVQEAIGKIIGDPTVARRGARESAAAAKQARGDDASPPVSDADSND